MSVHGVLVRNRAHPPASLEEQLHDARIVSDHAVHERRGAGAYSRSLLSST
jgi:hypothetical protein